MDTQKEADKPKGPHWLWKYAVLCPFYLLPMFFGGLDSSYVSASYLGKMFHNLTTPPIAQLGWSYSFDIEHRLFLYNPSFFIGIVIGLYRVHAWHHIFRALIPPALWLLPFVLLIVPAFFTVWGLEGIRQVFQYFVVISIPYSILGALIGWAIAEFLFLTSGKNDR